MSKAYEVPLGHTEICYEIKKSRFIARLQRVTNREQGMAFLEQARRDYPDARHHCWAYQLGTPHQPTSAAMSDDGEPSGTAGKPMLNVIQHKHIGDVMVIIIRYFGGIKLGAGGLVRAYSHATQMAFDEIKTETVTPLEDYTVSCSFADEQAIRHWLSQHQAIVGASNYSDNVELPVQIEESIYSELNAFLKSRANAAITKH